MEIIIFNHHSFVDVITNSSSELFVCDTTKSLEFITSFLQNALDTYNMGMGMDSDENIYFEQAFGEIYTIDENNFDDFFTNYVIDCDFSMWSWKLDPRQSYYDFTEKFKKENSLETKYPYSKNEKHNREIAKKVEDAWDSYIGAWSEINKPKVKEKALGHVVILSKNDNSIPYPLFDLIEGVLNATRTHLG